MTTYTLDVPVWGVVRDSIGYVRTGEVTFVVNAQYSDFHYRVLSHGIADRSSVTFWGLQSLLFDGEDAIYSGAIRETGYFTWNGGTQTQYYLSFSVGDSWEGEAFIVPLGGSLLPPMDTLGAYYEWAAQVTSLGGIPDGTGFEEGSRISYAAMPGVRVSENDTIHVYANATLPIQAGVGDDLFILQGTIGRNLYGGTGVDTLNFGDFSPSDVTFRIGYWGDGNYEFRFHGNGPSFVALDFEYFEFQNADGTVQSYSADTFWQTFIAPVVDQAGTDADDFLSGNNNSDRLVGLGGNDTLYGFDGADTLNGGDGHDVIAGGSNSFDLSDVIFAGAGNDFANGGYGNDVIYGGVGQDTLEGDYGADLLVGQAGNDELTGGALSDEIFGGDGADFLNGGFGHDRLNGGAGADRFYHIGIDDHGSDWIQDYSAAEGDVLAFRGVTTADDFQVNLVATEGAGAADTEEAFVIYRPTEQIIWALVDGAAQDSLYLRSGGITYDLFDLAA